MLFDWGAGGHHEVYLRRFAEALQPAFEVVVVIPDRAASELADMRMEIVRLGHARPAPRSGRSASWALRSVMATEIELLSRAAKRTCADHVVHMYADVAMPRLLFSRRLPAPLTVVLFYPRAHYPSLYETPLAARDRLRARVKESIVHGWRRRVDANAVLMLDPGAARIWARKRGAPVHWLPEPPIAVLPKESRRGAIRSGCILYGALAERKGIDLLTRALTLDRTPLRLTLAGRAYPDFLPKLEEYVVQMRRAGVTVDLRARRHTELDGLRALAEAQCALLPYPRHDGMSRVLVEAVSVGTPVIVHDRGLLGHLVRRHGLGLAVDCTDAEALRDAVLSFATENRAADYAGALARFAARFSPACFEQALLAPFGAGPPGVARNTTRRVQRRIPFRPRASSVSTDS